MYLFVYLLILCHLTKGLEMRGNVMQLYSLHKLFPLLIIYGESAFLRCEDRRRNVPKWWARSPYVRKMLLTAFMYVGYRYCQAPRQEGSPYGPQERGSLPPLARQSMHYISFMLTYRGKFWPVISTSSTDSSPAGLIAPSTRSVTNYLYKET